METIIEARLLAALKGTNVNLAHLNEPAHIDLEIDKLKDLKKRNGRQLLSLVIACYMVFLVLCVSGFFVTISFLDGFCKGFLIVGMFFIIIRVYLSRREFDKEIFILNLLKELKDSARN